MNLKHLFTALLLGTSAVAFGQSPKNEVGFQTDNDSYLANGSDRYYTNGLFLFYRKALNVNHRENSQLANKVLGFEVGQKMFNPQSGSVPDPIYIDRPFAGYLYVGANLNLLYQNESNLKLGAQIGVTGPMAGGQQAQEFIHNTFGFYPAQGWMYQIRNDYELNLSAEYNKLLLRAQSIDLSFSSYANLGNGFTGAGLGPVVRVGRFNQLFNSALTQSSVSAGNMDKLNKREFFAYYKPMINYIVYDATVQGSLFKDYSNTNQITSTPERFMLSNQVGLDYSSKHFTIDASVIFHTKDVKTMLRAHQWGSLTMLYRF